MSGRSLLVLTILALASCAREKDDKVGKIPEMPAQFRNGGISARVEGDAPEDRVVAMGVDPASLDLDQGGVAGLPSESDIQFLDPDNPEAAEAALKGLLSGKSDDWFLSHTQAKRAALNESKPLMILFTESPSAASGGSPAAAGLERELIARIDFAEWASEHFVRLKLDYNVKDSKSADAKKLGLALKKKKYLASLKKRYKVGGFPTILVIATDGSLIQSVRGYRNGNYQYVWGLLRTALVLNEERQEKFEKTLARKGYRRWKGKNDILILARLAAYKDGAVTLVAPNGVRYQTRESNLSDDDRLWIQEQKDKRGL